jgi:hypothetical protein
VPQLTETQTVGRSFGVPTFAFASVRGFVAKSGLRQSVPEIVGIRLI